MKKKSIEFVFIAVFALFFINFGHESYASLGTKVRICAVKGTVKILTPQSGSKSCPLTQKIDKTECKIARQTTFIETGPDGYAEIEYPSKDKIRIPPNTKIKILRNEIYVLKGISWLHISKNKKGALMIKTPTAYVGIRGTEFVVKVENDGSSQFQLINGRIEVSDASRQSKMLLKSGMTVSVQAGSSTLIPGILDIKEKDKWWTAWPTLVPLAKKASGHDEPGSFSGTGASNVYSKANMTEHSGNQDHPSAFDDASSISGVWSIHQSNGYRGTLTLQQDVNGQITGKALWNGNLKGTIVGKITGNTVVFTITYTSGQKGKYTGTLTQDGTKMINGNTSSQGNSARWDASR